jgi:hypothetical protein
MSRVRLPDDAIHANAARGMALNMTELAIATGYGESTIRKWKAEGLPLVSGRITKADALEWRRGYEVRRRELPRENYTVAHHPLLSAGRSNGRG